MHWDLRHLRTLLAIAEHGSLTDAAIALGISQAQVSRTLKALEDTWGVLLVRRRPREAVLTPEGRRAASRSRQLVRMAEQMVTEVRGEARLRIGYAWAAAGRHTSALQRRWRAEHPEGGLTLVRAEGPLAGLAEGYVDAAIVRREPDPRRFGSVLIGQERRVACFAEDDQWAHRPRLRMVDFAGRPLIIDSTTGTTVPEMWPEGERPYVALDVDSVEAWLNAVSAGHGVGVSSEATAHQHQRSDLSYRVITDAQPMGVWLAWHRGEDNSTLAEIRALLTELYADA